MNDDEKNKTLGFYSIIHGTILTDKTISEGSKMMYCYLTNLTNAKGYCWATNKYLAEVAQVTDREVRNRLKELKDKKYISITINRDEKNQVISRIITVTPYGTLVPYPMEQSFHTYGTGVPVEVVKEEKVKENNTPFINIPPNEEYFTEFWNAYPKCKRKCNQKNCKIAYLRISNLKEEHANIMKGLELWKKQWNDPNYIPAPLVFIHQERWKGIVEEENEKAVQQEKEEKAMEVSQDDMNNFEEMFNI